MSCRHESHYTIKRRASIKEAVEENDTPRAIVIFNENCLGSGKRWSSPDGDSDWPTEWEEDVFIDVYGEHFPDGDVEIVVVGEEE